MNEVKKWKQRKWHISYSIIPFWQDFQFLLVFTRQSCNGVVKEYSLFRILGLKIEIQVWRKNQLPVRPSREKNTLWVVWRCHHHRLHQFGEEEEAPLGRIGVSQVPFLGVVCYLVLGFIHTLSAIWFTVN